jgi:hypothetical protein
VATFDYRNAAGERVPGVTTVLSEWGEGSNGLMYWAWELGKSGKDLREERDRLADAGSLAHAMAEADITGKPAPSVEGIDGEIVAKALASFEAYRLWKASTRVELVAAEIPLVSEAHGYGGCIDAIVMFDGKPGLLDFKSAKSLYKKHVAQVSAYSRLWTENHPDLPLSHWHVLRWDPTGAFSHHSISADWESAGWTIFHRCLEIRKAKKLIRA